MNIVTLSARAKINLCLYVTAKRPDGYHEVETVLQTVALADMVTARRVNKPGYLKLATDLPFLPVDERNLAFRAARYMMDTYHLRDGVFIELIKNIPVAAGLAGGSADCAAVLVAMRALFSLPLTMADLAAIGRKFGADVPFCVSRGTAFATGIGDILTPLPTPRFYAVLAKPSVAVPTQTVFERLKLPLTRENTAPQLVAAIRAGDLPSLCAHMGNDLETVTAALHPIINDLKAALTASGAFAAQMSGSGPTVFGVFASRAAAVAAFRALRRQFPGVTEICVTRTFP